ncbi:agmatine deiminase family protein [Rhizobium daejeonense]|uniref:Agmatine deiminase family protein n=1 Tax=Rhizobium daejeonense TaxID=240521 RepID=A0A6M1S4L4_9HYPH|nr:agmatine deiminase family protein [Rhizobium daejeonense]NGO65995.1 agmatine deiminase family protein [Rhizobium daejeonense]
MHPSGRQPTLVADCGGLIEQVAFAVPDALVDSARGSDDGLLLPIGNMIAALPEEVIAFVVVGSNALPAAKTWLARLKLACSLALIPVGGNTGGAPSPWIQDFFHVRTHDTGAVEILSRPDNAVASHLARAIGAGTVPVAFDLAGGDQLVGPDFRLVGWSSMKTNGLQTGDAAGLQGPAILTEVDHRPIRIFGYQVADLSPISLTDTGGTVPFSGRLHQVGFHVDQFVSVTGLERGGRPLLLVGEPDAPASPENSLLVNLRRQLDASVTHLIRQGFAVLRNPIPLVITSDSGKRLPRLYNNLLVENGLRPGRQKPLVWLPQFGDLEPLEDYDRANIRIWEELSYDVIPVSGWSRLASRNGALRCASKVISRQRNSPVMDKPILRESVTL